MTAVFHKIPFMVLGGLLALVSHVRARVTLNLLMTLGGRVLIFQISRILYHILLHHLAKLSGPPLRSGFLFTIKYLNELRGIQAKKASALHDRYGPRVRIRPDYLSFNTVKAWKDICAAKLGKPEIPKDKGIFIQNTNNVSSLLGDSKHLQFRNWLYFCYMLVCSYEDHVRLKRLVSDAFSDSALRGRESLMTKHTELLVHQLKRQVSAGQGGQSTMSLHMLTALDILSEHCFAEPMKALASGAYKPWIVTTLNTVKKGSHVRLEVAYPVLAGIRHLYRKISSGSSKVDTSRAGHMGYLIEKTEWRVDSDMKRTALTILFCFFLSCRIDSLNIDITLDPSA
ncbi:hypothetical protein BDR22DRAFT_977968 [Usnea florida]